MRNRSSNRYMEQLALGRNVTLVSDPTQDATDGFGRSLFYIDRDDGLDVGQEMVRAGWAEVFVFERDFLRLSAYLDAEGDAEGSVRGVWKRCDGDFDFSRADELRERRFRLWTSCGATTGASQTASSPRPGGCCRDAFVET